MSASCLGVTAPDVDDDDDLATVSLTFATANINSKIEDTCSRRGGVIGRDEYLRGQFHQLGFHAIGVQKAYSKDGKPVTSSNYVRLIAGPRGGAVMGDVEF